MSTSAPDGQPRSEIEEALQAAGHTGPYVAPPWVQAAGRDDSSNRAGGERVHRERGDGSARRLVRWLIACGACAATLALIWLAGELWWRWDRSTAVLVASTAALVVLAPFSWWASRELTTVERSGSHPPTAGHETPVSVAGNIGGSMITGDNNMIYTGGATSSPTAQRPERPGVGEGAGSRRPLIAELHARTGGFVALGEAREPAFKVNGGHVQFFDRDDHQSFLVWLPPTGSGSVMSESVWEALCAVGEAEWPVLAGLPVAGTAPLVIDDQTLRVPLAGGRWQGGWLIRERSGQPWFWLPEPRHDAYTSHATIWERDSAYEVRIRAIVDMAWHGEPRIRTLEECIGQLKAAASAGRFSNLFAVLGASFGVELAEPTWSVAKSNNNWARGVHMTAPLADPEGQPAVKADVMLQVPAESYPHSLLGCVDLHLNLRAWRDCCARLARPTSQPSLSFVPSFGCSTSRSRTRPRFFRALLRTILPTSSSPCRRSSSPRSRRVRLGSTIRNATWGYRMSSISARSANRQRALGIRKR